MVTTVAELDLDAITARSNAATPGPWAERSVGYVFATATSERAAESGYIGTPVVDTFMWPEHGPANQVFIAHAREDVPALVAEVRRLRGRIEQAWDEGAEFAVGYATAPLYENPYRSGKRP